MEARAGIVEPSTEAPTASVLGRADDWRWMRCWSCRRKLLKLLRFKTADDLAGVCLEIKCDSCKTLNYLAGVNST